MHHSNWPMSPMSIGFCFPTVRKAARMVLNHGDSHLSLSLLSPSLKAYFCMHDHTCIYAHMHTPVNMVWVRRMSLRNVNCGCSFQEAITCHSHMSDPPLRPDLALRRKCKLSLYTSSWLEYFSISRRLTVQFQPQYRMQLS